MRRVLIDCGVREGDAVAAFLGDDAVGFGAYHRCLRPREDAHEYQIVGFEAPDFKYLEVTRRRFEGVHFELIEKIVWVEDGFVEFDSDGESCDNRIFQVSCAEGVAPWRHPSPSAEIKWLPCLDLARFLLGRYAPPDFIVLKLDIEGAEYEVLMRLIQSGAIDLVSELYVEYHWWGSTRYRGAIEAAIRQRPHIHYRNDWP